MNRLDTRPAQLLFFIILAGSMVGLSSGCGTAPRSTAPAATAQAHPTATPDPTISPTPQPSPQAFTVGNTDGQGVYLRRSPLGERIRAWPDGTVMIAIGGDQIVDGKTWRNVKDPDGNDGWALADYLVPRKLTPAATSLPTSTPATETPTTN